MFKSSTRTLSLAIAFAFITAFEVGGQQAGLDLAVRPLANLRSGTVLSQVPGIGPGQTVLLALPRLAAGDLDAISEGGRRMAQMFQMAIAADVLSTNRDNQPPYHLKNVAVGFVVDKDGQRVVVSSKDGGQHGVKLGMLGSGVLAANEASLKKTRQIAATDSMTIFDADATVLHNGHPEQMFIRHVIWVDPNSGQLGLLIWLMAKQDSGDLQLAHPHMHAVTVGTTEDRQIHVDKDKFLFGMPTANSFALIQITPGHPITWSEEFAAVAALPQYTPQTFASFVTALEANLQQATVAKRQ